MDNAAAATGTWSLLNYFTIFATSRPKNDNYPRMNRTIWDTPKGTLAKLISITAPPVSSYPIEFSMFKLPATVPDSLMFYGYMKLAAAIVNSACKMLNNGRLFLFK
jgi:hypothetical protein